MVGGYYVDHGYVKYGYPMAAAMTVLAWGIERYKRALMISDEYKNAMKGNFQMFFFLMINDLSILFQKIFNLLCLSSTLKYNSAVKWGAEYFIKCHTSEYEFYGQVNEPDKLDEYWGRPEDLPEVYDVRSYKESSQLSISTQIKKDIQRLIKRIRNEMILNIFHPTLNFYFLNS